METIYDEDLNENTFFQILRKEHNELYEKASTEGWVICVPRSGSLPKYDLTDEDFLSHILIPSDELPETHFRSLNGKEIKIFNRLISVENNDVSQLFSTHILFEETFYRNDLSKYKVLCIENSLERQVNSSEQDEESKLVIVQGMRDSLEFLWTESGRTEVLERLDEAIRNFLVANENLELKPLQSQRDIVGTLYALCLQVTLKDTRLREKSKVDKHFLENIKVSVETYMHRGIYQTLFKGITACTAYDDAYLNKVVRNLSDIQLRDLEVRIDLYDSIPRAKQELVRIEGFSTVLGKIGCLKRMILTISKSNASQNSVNMVENVVTADDLLPVIVFLIIKSGLPNWTAHLTYMKQFRFSSCNACQVDECSFLITTLEAAIEHIKAGILHGPSAPEAQHVFEGCSKENGTNSLSSAASGETSCISHFFEQVRLGNLEEVRDIISVSSSDSEKFLPRLCHPLCSCDKCESLLKKNLCDTKPTVYSCDDRGCTALHVGCLFGRPLVVELLINSGANVNASDYSGSTALHYAAAKGHQNALLLLLHSQAIIDARDSDGNTALHLACNNGHEDCVKALLYFAEHSGIKLNPDVKNMNGNTPLHNAARWGYENIIQILLDYGASPSVENKRRLTPINYAHNPYISKLLLNFSQSMSKSKSSDNLESDKSDSSSDIPVATKPELDFSDDSVKVSESDAVIKQRKLSYGKRASSTEAMKKVERLLRAIAFGDVRLACYYLGLDNLNEDSTSVDVKALCHPLCMCKKCQPDDSLDASSEDTVKKEKEVLNVNICNSDGFTPLHVAAMHGQADLVTVLLDAGANVNLVTKTKNVTALHLACQNERTVVTKVLLQSANCDIDIQDSSGNTALHYASLASNSKLVELLLKYSPAVDIKNTNGRTPLDEAEDKLALSVIRLLKGGEMNPILPWEEVKDV